MGLTLRRTDSSSSITFNMVTSFRYELRRFVEAVPMPGMEDSDNPDQGSLVFDVGGVAIVYQMEFEEAFKSQSELHARYREIESFFASMTVLSGVIIDFPELGISGRKGVAKSFSIEIRGGEVNFLRGRLEIIGGELM